MYILVLKRKYTYGELHPFTILVFLPRFFVSDFNVINSQSDFSKGQVKN